MNTSTHVNTIMMASITAPNMRVALNRKWMNVVIILVEPIARWENGG